MKSDTKKDVAVILSISLVFVSLYVYVIFEGSIMDFGQDASHPLIREKKANV